MCVLRAVVENLNVPKFLEHSMDSELNKEGLVMDAEQ